jgi:arginine deiminase
MNGIVDSAHGGLGWIARNKSHTEEIGEIWSNCGVISESDELRHVLLRRPGKEIENIIDPQDILWLDRMDPSLARYQHDNLVEVYKNYGIKVDYIDSAEADQYPNIIYVRDTFTMTPQGAILSRLASQVRSGEERIILKELIDLNVPVLASPFNNMFLEGPDIVIVNKDLVFLGIGIRTNIMAVDFVTYLLKLQGFSEIITIQTTYGCGHLDGVVNILNSKNAAIVPKRCSYEIYTNLKKHGFNIVELNHLHEVDDLMSINFVPLNAEVLVINKGAKETVSQYNSVGIECIEVDISELTKGGGSIHCLTGILRRD